MKSPKMDLRNRSTIKRSERNSNVAKKSTGDLLFEIGCEEIPAGMISKSAQEFKSILSKYCTTAGLLDEASTESCIETFGAPRRLVAVARNVRLKQEDVAREITGPPKSVAFDNVGEPTRAAMSFAEKQGIPVSQLTIVSTPKGEYVAAKQVVQGQPAAADHDPGVLSRDLRVGHHEIGLRRTP